MTDMKIQRKYEVKFIIFSKQWTQEFMQIIRGYVKHLKSGFLRWIVNGFLPLTIFAKSPIWDVGKGWVHLWWYQQGQFTNNLLKPFYVTVFQTVYCDRLSDLQKCYI